MTTPALGALLWLGGALFAAAGDEVPAPPAASIRTRTDWVVVPVNLRPAEGTALPATFAPDDFRLFVDGKEVRRFSFLPEKNAPLLGQTVDVLVESIEKNGRRHGRTPDCKPVFVDGSAAQPGDAIAARIVWAGPFSLVAAAT